MRLCSPGRPVVRRLSEPTRPETDDVSVWVARVHGEVIHPAAVAERDH